MRIVTNKPVIPDVEGLTVLIHTNCRSTSGVVVSILWETLDPKRRKQRSAWCIVNLFDYV
jgi:hypothetical protein